MKGIFKAIVASATTVALVATLVLGFNFAKAVKADGTEVTLGTWSFSRGGNEYNSEYLNGNEGRIGSVTLDPSGEVITGFKTASAPLEEKFATQSADSFKLDITNLGWTRGWKNVEDPSQDNFDPWQIQAKMNGVKILPGHDYTITFKGKAEGTKYAYVSFGSENPEYAPQGDDIVKGDAPVIALTSTEKTFSYTLTNWAETQELNVLFMLGNFSAKLDWGGNDWSSVITDYDAGFRGNVYISDFKVLDLGQNPEYETAPAIETGTMAPVVTTKAPTPTVNPQPQTQAQVKKLNKVKGLKVKNTKKKTIKVSYKKVANAKKYQIKVGSKKFNTSATKKTIKKNFIKKGKKITVKVRATATGYTAGAWATKKIKIKK